MKATKFLSPLVIFTILFNMNLWSMDSGPVTEDLKRDFRQSIIKADHEKLDKILSSNTLKKQDKDILFSTTFDNKLNYTALQQLFRHFKSSNTGFDMKRRCARAIQILLNNGANKEELSESQWLLINNFWQKEDQRYGFIKSQSPASALIDLRIGDAKYGKIPISLLTSWESTLKYIFQEDPFAQIHMEKDSEGFYFFYRVNGHLFKQILEFLESGKVILQSQNERYALLEEARYFNISDLIAYLAMEIWIHAYIGLEEFPYKLWKEIPIAPLKIILKTHGNNHRLYYILNETTRKIIGNKSLGEIDINSIKNALDLARNNIVPAFTGTCYLPYNCLNNTPIGVSHSLTNLFDLKGCMENIVGHHMCSSDSHITQPSYGIFNIYNGRRSEEAPDAYYSFQSCVQALREVYGS